MLTTFLTLLNETLAAAIVVMATSLLLYNLTRNRRDRVARASAILLACVTVAYVTDVFVSLGPGLRTYEVALRLQWIGIAYMPAALFHLSDALLATTGLVSRGRRRRAGKFLYLLSSVFLAVAGFSDLLVDFVPYRGTMSMRAGPLFPVYTAYFITAAGFAFYNVQRARQRCLTRDTRRRMAYLQVAMLTPAIGVFPFSVFITPSEEIALLGLVLVNLTNVVVILMLLFLAYPLSFFGSRVPDRVVKVDLLRFLMRGPATAMLALAAIIFVAPATRILGLPGETFLPFAVVGVVLLWQWFTHLSLPYLERRLVYPGEDFEQLERLQNLSERLLTRTDLLQLLEAILSATCDYLRVPTAFVARFADGELELVSTVGPTRPTADLLQDEADSLRRQFEVDDETPIHPWYAYWLMPLHSARPNPDGHPALIGVLGIQARAAEIDLEQDEWRMLRSFVRRAAQTLDDLTLQRDIFAALEGLLPQIALTRAVAVGVEFKPGRALAPPADEPALDRRQFNDQVKAALTHLYGGPGLTESRLLDLGIVQDALPDNDNNPTRALRAVLLRAIENQKPEGERRMTDPQWIVYNVLDYRFVKGVKIREIALRLAMSDATYYRRQTEAVAAVADALLRLENERRDTPHVAALPAPHSLEQTR